MIRTDITRHHNLDNTAILITRAGARRNQKPHTNLHFAPFGGWTQPKGRTLCISRAEAAYLLREWRKGQQTGKFALTKLKFVYS